MFRIFRLPLCINEIFPGCIWNVKGNENSLYLTFDDGPHPHVTPWVMEQLDEYDAKATFFCVGKNVEKHPAVYESILNAGHGTGNHTQHHLDGWKSKPLEYIKDVNEAGKLIDSKLFRPPHGKISCRQLRLLRESGYAIIMWSLLSYDFDVNISPDKCLGKLKTAKSGDIIVFHDSLKAFPKLKGMLPVLLKYWKDRNYQFKALDLRGGEH